MLQPPPVMPLWQFPGTAPPVETAGPPPGPVS